VSVLHSLKKRVRGHPATAGANKQQTKAPAFARHGCLSSLHETFRVFLKSRDNPVLVQGEKADLDNSRLLITDAQGKTVGEFVRSEVQGWDVMGK
jgi:hypothetical protein